MIWEKLIAAEYVRRRCSSILLTEHWSSYTGKLLSQLVVAV